MRLITIPISHYCERARWALTYAGVPYREERHLQGFSRRAVRRVLGRGSTVPVLVTPEGRVLDSSCHIVEFASAHAQQGAALYPSDPARRDEVVALEQRLRGRFGAEVRRVAYGMVLSKPRRFLSVNNIGAPRAQRWLFSPLMLLLAGTIRRRFGATAEGVAASLKFVRTEFDWVSARLGGRRYLVGESFGAADLTFAALAAPMVFPPGYGVKLPAAEVFGAQAREVIASFRAHPAGRYALRLYSDHRARPPG